MSESKRLFIAINLSEKTRKELLTLCGEMRLLSERGRFTLPENLHLTLAFLGECDAQQTEAAKRAINVLTFKPFTITITGGGYLDKGRPNLVFCELKNDIGRNELFLIQSKLSESLSAKGFKLDKRKFWPHITLGREVVWKNTGDYSSFIDTGFPLITERVTSIELMKSERINGKLTYTSIHELKSLAAE